MLHHQQQKMFSSIDTWAQCYKTFYQGNLPPFHGHTIMENLMVIRVEVIAPEKPLLSKHLQK